MKLERQIGILSVLLQCDKVTAPYLAEKFEVSRRTINRDIETLCAAGIPIVSIRGSGGGISIMEGYRLDKTLLTSADMESIISGLGSIDSISGTNKVRMLMEKLSVDSSNLLNPNNNILIDLSSWHKAMLTEKIELIQSAISNANIISFKYYAPSGESERRLEPYKLIFKWSSWYVWGYCLKRCACRMFKLNRIVGLLTDDERFEKRQLEPPKISAGGNDSQALNVSAIFDESAKWRLVDEFGYGSFSPLEDGRLMFSADFDDRESLLAWILTFGDKAELLEPHDLRRELGDIGRKISEKYNETGGDGSAF